MLIPEVTVYIQVGQDCRLSRKSMLQNFRIYLESYIENIYPIFDELQKHMFTKKSVSSD